MIVHLDDDADDEEEAEPGDIIINESAILNPNLPSENGDSIVDETESTTDSSVSNSIADNRLEENEDSGNNINNFTLLNFTKFNIFFSF